MIKQTIKKINKDGSISVLEVDWEKMPCFKCEWRWSMHCPKCDWNKDGHVVVY